MSDDKPLGPISLFAWTGKIDGPIHMWEGKALTAAEITKHISDINLGLPCDCDKCNPNSRYNAKLKALFGDSVVGFWPLNNK